MSIALLCTKGFSNGSLVGSIADMATRGYTIGVAVVTIGYLFTEATISYTRDLNSSVGYTRNLEAVIK